ncbi:arginine repressor [Bacillus sp. V3-13]|uniref:arginine repressor n=1 Tax=Bacillus sp. V3-13 TaxID=2053728 RepID=UPI000C780AE5|nr:arginine repressor [Bacillus sp. V3-13]PLR76203.1 arginine repressor [Bacillus sp. V3-13]
MKKEMRLQQIKKLISEQEIKTQEELCELLLKIGFQVTQATISRDIRTLNLIKVPSVDGGQKYSFRVENDHYTMEKFQHKIKDALVDIEVINFFILLKTLPGHAHSFGVFLDAMKYDGKAGTICGNDTVLIICRSPEAADKLKQQIESYRK